MPVGILKNIIPTNIFAMFKPLGMGFGVTRCALSSVSRAAYPMEPTPIGALPYTKYSIWSSDKKIQGVCPVNKIQAWGCFTYI
jgi:hypothetical protein